MSEKPKKKQGGKSEARPSLGSRVIQKWRNARTTLRELSRGLISPDQPTRRMAVLFYLSLIGSLLVLIYFLIHFYGIWSERAGERVNEQQENLSRLVERQREAAHSRFSTLDLGKFIIELKPDKGARARAMNIGEIEITIECDGKVTCDRVSAELTRARDMVSTILLATERQELLSPDGKRRLKRDILERLNTWLYGVGQVKEVYFTRMLLN